MSSTEIIYIVIGFTVLFTLVALARILFNFAQRKTQLADGAGEVQGAIQDPNELSPSVKQRLEQASIHQNSDVTAGQVVAPALNQTVSQTQSTDNAPQETKVGEIIRPDSPS